MLWANWGICNLLKVRSKRLSLLRIVFFVNSSEVTSTTEQEAPATPTYSPSPPRKATRRPVSPSAVRRSLPTPPLVGKEINRPNTAADFRMRRFESLIFVRFFFCCCCCICLAPQTGDHTVQLLFMSLGRQGLGIVVKCSNLTAGLCLLLFTSLWVSFENWCTIFSSERSKACRSPLGMAPNFWLLGKIVIFFTLKRKVHIYPFPKLKRFKIHTLWGCHSLLAWNVSYLPASAWGLGWGRTLSSTFSVTWTRRR